MPEFQDDQYKKEEFANALTHGIGILLSILGTPFLIQFASDKNANSSELFGLGIFCFSMVILYTLSTIYHSVHTLKWKPFCRKLDHIAIFLLIAGSHTPFILSYLNNTKGWTYLAILWGLGILGSIGKIFFFEKWEKPSLLLYIFMGWMVVFILPDLMPIIPKEVFLWIGFGGFSYTVGVYFFVKDNKFYFHTIWHIFVLGGTASHYMALWKIFENT
jgi:hemolysin III